MTIKETPFFNRECNPSVKLLDLQVIIIDINCFVAVVMITTLKRLLHYDCLICVKQYRPPLKAYTLEFPAGKLHSFMKRKNWDTRLPSY